MQLRRPHARQDGSAELVAGALALLLPLLCAPAARAASPATAYEEALQTWALEQAGLERDPAPEGKVIERVEIVREEIFTPSDPWPDLLNYAHVKTKDHVVRRELLIGPGDVWDAELVEESARNLRSFYILGVVRALPCRSQRPGHVVLLVVTRDIWSIRLNQSFLQVGQVLHRYEAWPTEQNFLGLNRRLSLNLRVQQYDWGVGRLYDSFTLGELYYDPRLFGSRVSLLEEFRVVMSGEVPCGGLLGADGRAWCPDTQQGTPEGVHAQLRLQRPLYALSARWAFDLYGIASLRRVREYRFNSGEEPTPAGEVEGLSIRADPFDDAVAVPRVYDARELTAVAQVTRARGDTVKQELTGGAVARSSQYTHPDNLRLAAVVLDWHAARFLPRSEDAAYLFARYRIHQPSFVKLYNLQSFAFGEDVTLGPDLLAEARMGSALDDLDLAFVVLLAQARYRWYRFDDLFSVGAAVHARLQPGLRGRPEVDPAYLGDFYDGHLLLEASNAFPLMWIGRLHLRGRTILRRSVVNAVEWEPLPLVPVSTRRVYLGADSGLRGYVSGSFEGDSLVQGSVEFRTVALDILTAQAGLVVFYDGGGVFGGPDPADPSRELAFAYKHTVGLGFRGFFPQFDKEVLRIDLGVPLTADRGDVGTWFSMSFGQVF